MKEALRAYPVTRFAEQDFLNDFFKGHWNMLPLSFNWGKPNFWLCPELCRSEAVKVVHFSGAVKPWLRKPDGQWSDSVLARAIPEERKLLEDGNSGLTWAHEKWWSSFLFQTEAKVVCDATLSLRGDPRPACYSTLISGDSDYYKGVLALAGSLRRHGCRLPLLVAHTSDVPAAHCRAMREAGCELRLVDSEAFSSLRGTPKQPEFLVCYNKLSMWLWEDYKLVIYLDADVVVNRNIDHLEKLELPLDYIAAAPDLGFATNGTGNRNGERYFNAGVMIFRPDRRSHRRLMDALMTYGKITAYAEQDFLNDYFADRLVELPTEYNFIQDYWVGPSLPPSPMREESLRSLGEGLPAVVHYAGAKPWRCRLAERLLQGLSFGSEDERQRTVIALDRIQAEWEGALRAGTKTMSRAEDALRPEWGKECGGGIAGGPRKIRAEVGELQCAGARVPAA
uniref:Hexosyltransferase n=1 Tax=Tetraselmis sp. GSL018 TaxID=582737 RepID=A0A061R241_9CHLO